MNVTCDRSYFAHALGVAGRSVSPRNTMAILSHVLLETFDDRLRITSTDLDTAIRCVIPATVAQNGAVALPAASLSDYISKLSDGPVTLEVEDGKVSLRSAHSRIRLPSAPAEDFPVIPEVSAGPEITLTQASLKDMLRMTAFAASREEGRSVSMGVLFEANETALTLVATDTHRLALKRATLWSPVERPISAVIPAKPLVELERFLKNSADEMVTIRFGGNQVQFSSTDVTLVSRVLDGQFPNYNRVIPKQSERRITFDREQLLSAVRRVDIVARNNSQKMVVKTAGDRMHMTAESLDSGQAEEEVPISMEGSDLTIAFNCRYLMEVLGIITEENAAFELNGPLNPGILRAGEDFLYVVMPMSA